jgi:glutamate-1-semialdehyde 2,1-aminomutase
MTAVRVARGFTGRQRIVVFSGCYHGHADTLLAAGGSGMATLGLPGSAGVPPAAVADTLVVPYNVVPELAEDVACVVVEPVAANMGVVPPRPGFLEGLRAACDRAGALLVFDEVITGFRLGPAGAQGRLGVTPDLTCFGKVIGGGLPLAAFGGRADVMAVLAPEGPVYQAGTLSGNPLATAAGLAVLDLLDGGAYVKLEGRAAELADGLRDVMTSAGVPVQVPVAGPLVGLFFSADPVHDHASATAADPRRYAAFFHAMLDRGVALPPSPFEAMFPSLAHSRHDIERTVDLAAAAAKST